MNLSKIPRNIFQTWATKDMSPDMDSLMQSWRNCNPNYAYFLFDDADCEVFLQKHFDKTVYDAYRKLYRVRIRPTYGDIAFYIFLEEFMWM